MIKIEELKNYTIPYCGNKRIQPYGDLVISDGESRKTCKIQDDGAKQYFTFNRKRYYVRNAGTLYSPKFVIVGSIEDAAERVKEAGYKYEIQSETVLMVYYKDNSNDHTQVSLCDDSRYGYYMIEGRVQNITDWIKRGYFTGGTYHENSDEPCGVIKIEEKEI